MSNRSLFHGGSSVGRRDKILVPSRFLNRQGSWNDMDLLNVNNGLSDLMYGEQKHNWTGIEDPQYFLLLKPLDLSF